MPEPDLLTLFVARLEELGATHLVTGSVAATLFGEPRATHDIDLVVELPQLSTTTSRVSSQRRSSICRRPRSSDLVET